MNLTAIKALLILIFLVGNDSSHPLIAQKFQFNHYGEKDGLSNEFVYDIIQDDDGMLWAATGDGIYHFGGIKWHKTVSTDDYSNALFRHLCIIDHNIYSVNDHGDIIEISETKEIQKWYSSTAGSRPIYFEALENGFELVYQNGKYSRIDFNKDITEKEQFGTEIQFCTRHKNVLYLFKDDELMSYDGKNTSYLKLADINASELPKTIQRILKNKKVTDQHIDDNFQYISTQDGLIIEANDKRDKKYSISSLNGLGTNFVSSVFTDRENTLWIGTFGYGIYSVPAYSFRLYPLRSGVKDMITHDEKLYAVSEDSVFIYSLNHSRRYPQLIFDTSYYVEGAQCISLFENNVTIGTKGYGLKQINSDGVSKQDFPFELNYVNGIDSFDNHTYFSTAYEGVINYNTTDGILNEFNTTNGLPYNDINSIVVDGEIKWFLSNLNGVYKLENNAWQTFTEEEGLSNSPAQQGIKLKQGLLVTTEGSGVVLFNKGNVSYLHSELQGLPQYAYGLFETEQFIVISSANSILLLNKDLNRIENDLYSSSNLVRSKICSLNDRTLAISSDEGIIMLNLPEQIDLPDARIKIKSFEAKGINYEISELIELPYGEYNIRVNIQAISPNHARNILYSYKLVGYDEEWSKPIALEEIRYQKLSEGDYVLKIRPVLPYGAMQFEETEIKFTIQDPFWKSTTFIALSVLSIIILIVLITEIRNRSIKKYSRKLRDLVRSRTKQLEAQNVRLEEYTYAISHDLKNPVINIKGIAEILEAEDVSPEERKEMISLLDKSSSQLLNNLLGLIQAIKAGQLNEDNSTEIDLKTLVDEIETSISLEIKSTKATIIRKFKVQSIQFDKENLRSILYNLLSNALKYKDDHRLLIVDISSYSYEEGVVLEVSDNGLGMDLVRDGDNLFGMFKRVHDHVEGSGLGMYLVNSIVERAGGHIKVESKIGKGTTFKIYLPVIDNSLIGNL